MNDMGSVSQISYRQIKVSARKLLSTFETKPVPGLEAGRLKHRLSREQSRTILLPVAINSFRLSPGDGEIAYNLIRFAMRSLACALETQETGRLSAGQMVSLYCGIAKAEKFHYDCAFGSAARLVNAGLSPLEILAAICRLNDRVQKEGNGCSGDVYRAGFTAYYRLSYFLDVCSLTGADRTLGKELGRMVYLMAASPKMLGSGG